MRRRVASGLLACIALASLATAGWAGLGAAAGPSDPLEIRIRYSRYLPAEITVDVGRQVTLVIRNDDPIDHEWIVGDEALHERHRTGTEPVHDARPTEVTVPALESRETTVVFATPGRYRFVCHLPGHEAFGMVGVVTVVP